MAAGAVAVEGVRPAGGWARRATRALTHAPLNILLLVVALLWLVPSFGLLVTSFRTNADYASSGWWTVFSKPGQLTLSTYHDLLKNPAILQAFRNTWLITVP